MTLIRNGYSLLIVSTLVALLLMLGFLVMDSVLADIRMAGADRTALVAFYAADAGAQWGVYRVDSILYPVGSSVAQPQNVGVLPLIQASDPVCSNTTCPLFGWHQLSLDLTQPYTSFGDGFYRVVARCDPEPCVNGVSKRIVIRSLGRSGEGAERLVEMILGLE